MSGGDPRIMIWMGDHTWKPDPFYYWINEDQSKDDHGNVSQTSWTLYPYPNLVYDDNGVPDNRVALAEQDGSGTTSVKFPMDFNFGKSAVTCLVHNYNPGLVAIYKCTSVEDDTWDKVTGNITWGLQKYAEFDPHTTFRVDFVGGE